MLLIFFNAAKLIISFRTYFAAFYRNKNQRKTTEYKRFLFKQNQRVCFFETEMWWKLVSSERFQPTGCIFDLFYLRQDVFVLDDVFIRRYEDVKLAAAELRDETPTQTRSSLKWKRQKKIKLAKQKQLRWNKTIDLILPCKQFWPQKEPICQVHKPSWTKSWKRANEMCQL